MPRLTDPSNPTPPNPQREAMRARAENEARGLWILINKGDQPPTKGYEKKMFRMLITIVEGFFGVDARVQSMHKSITAAGGLANRVFNTGQSLLRFYERRELARYKAFVDLREWLREHVKVDDRALDDLEAIDAVHFGYPDREAFMAEIMDCGEELFRESKMEQANRPDNAEDRLANHITNLVHNNPERVQKNLFSNIDPDSMTALMRHMLKENMTKEQICEKLKLSDAQYAALKETVHEEANRIEDSTSENEEQPDGGSEGDTVTDGTPPQDLG